MNQKTPSVLNLATYLTISRFLLVPVFIYYFLINNFKFAVLVLVVASVTDVTDGFLARRCNMGTRLGAVLDPLADKFLMLISFLVLAAEGLLPWWLAVVVIGRDFYIVFGVMYLYFVKHLEITPKPTKLAKRTTFAQFILLTLSFIKAYVIVVNPIQLQNYRTLLFNFQRAMVFVALILTIATFVQYTQVGFKILKEGKQHE